MLAAMPRKLAAHARNHAALPGPPPLAGLYSAHGLPTGSELSALVSAAKKIAQE